MLGLAATAVTTLGFSELCFQPKAGPQTPGMFMCPCLSSIGPGSSLLETQGISNERGLLRSSAPLERDWKESQ